MYKIPDYKTPVYKIPGYKIPEYKIIGYKIQGAKYGYKNGVQAFEHNFPAISMHDLRLFYNNDDTPDDIKASVWKHISDFNLINILA